MKNEIFSAIKFSRNWLVINLMIIALLLISISLFYGGAGGAVLSESLFFTGIFLLFVALLNLWGCWNRKYYAILSMIAVLLFLLLLKSEIDTLVKIQSKFKISSHWVEDMLWSFGLILIVGFLAGLIGIFIQVGRKNNSYAGLAVFNLSF